MNHVGFFSIFRVKFMCRVPQLISIGVAKKAINTKLFWSQRALVKWHRREFATGCQQWRHLDHSDPSSPTSASRCRRAFGSNCGMCRQSRALGSSEAQHQLGLPLHLQTTSIWWDTRHKKGALTTSKVELNFNAEASTRDDNPIRRKAICSPQGATCSVRLLHWWMPLI